jgi:hypothetical protein
MITHDFKATVDGKEVEFTVLSPSNAHYTEAQKVYNTAFSEAVKSNAIVRAKMDDVLRDQGLWDDKKEAEYTQIVQEIADGERTLKKGGIKLSEARSLALSMADKRSKLRDLVSVKTSLDNQSAEGQADNAKFNYLVSACVVYKSNNQPYYKSLEDYLNSSASEVSLVGAKNLANMLYGLEDDFEKKLPENKFLTKYKFVNEDLQLVNKEGHTVDREGRLIDKYGRFVNEKGEYVDRQGNLIDDSGDYIVDEQPFLDDNGKPIVEEEPETKTQETPTEEQQDEEKPKPVAKKPRQKKATAEAAE